MINLIALGLRSILMTSNECLKPLLLFAWLICLAELCASQAFALGTDMFVCTDDNGVRTYQNQANGKGCRKLNLEPLTSIPAPKSSSNPNASANSASTPSKQSASPVSAARYDASIANRESDRRRILEDELRREELKLGELKAEFNQGQPERRADDKTPQKYQERTARLKDDISRAESNINALKREISKLSL